MKKWIVILFITCLPVLAFTAEPLDAGSKFINFEWDRGTLISGGYFLSDWFSVQGGIGVAFNRETRTNGFAAKIGIDQYLNAGNLAPYVGGYARFDSNPNALGETGWKGSRLLVGGNWGVSYFVLKDLSISGNIGAEFQFNSPKNADSSTNISTFTSALAFRYYF